MDYLVQDCVFCDIIADRSPAEYIDSTSRTIAIVPLNPVVSGGHVIVIPRIHVSDFMEDPMTSANTMYDVANLATSLERQHGGDWNLITSAGPAATQTVMHLHVHLVRRTEGDGLHLPWTGQK